MFHQLKLLWLCAGVTGNNRQNILLFWKDSPQIFLRMMPRAICTVINTLCKPQSFFADWSRDINYQDFVILQSGVTTKPMHTHRHLHDQQKCLETHLINFQSKPHLIKRELLIIGAYLRLKHMLLIGNNIRDN